MKNTTVKAQVKKAFKGYTVEMQDDYINIARPDGAHCEFYGHQEKGLAFASATYTINGQIKELDFFLPDQLDDFVETVKKILTF